MPLQTQGEGIWENYRNKSSTRQRKRSRHVAALVRASIVSSALAQFDHYLQQHMNDWKSRWMYGKMHIDRRPPMHVRFSVDVISFWLILFTALTYFAF